MLGNSWIKWGNLQMQKRGVCLVRFDDKLGPGCVYHQGLDNNFAQKVCVKSHLSTMSLSSSQTFPEEEFIGSNTEEEKQNIINERVQEDFDNKINWSISNVVEETRSSVFFIDNQLSDDCTNSH